MNPFKSEEEVAEIVVNGLWWAGWETYQEVKVYESVFDIVAVKSGIVWIIEVKRTFSLALYEQGIERKDYGHLVSVAHPTRVARDRNIIINDACRKYGLGVMHIARPQHLQYMYSVHGRAGDGRRRYNLLGHVAPGLDEVFRPRLDAKPCLLPHLTNRLMEEQKTFCKAGSARGGYWTPFKQTMKNLSEFVHANPNCTVAEAEAGIDYHWASKAGAKSAIISWVREGKCEGVEIDDRETPYRLMPKRAKKKRKGRAVELFNT